MNEDRIKELVSRFRNGSPHLIGDLIRQVAKEEREAIADWLETAPDKYAAHSCYDLAKRLRDE